MSDAAIADPGPARAFGDADSRYRSVGSALVSLLEGVRGAETLHQAAQAAVERLVVAFGASRGLLLLLEDSSDPKDLVPVAAVGAHSALVREMPSISLGSDTDVARVTRSGRPIFRGDVHGLGADDAGRLNGLARWRTGVGVQAEAILALTARDRIIGVLSLEWSTPQVLDAGERRSLTTAAESTALILDVFSEEEAPRVASAQASIPSANVAGSDAAPLDAAPLDAAPLEGVPSQTAPAPYAPPPVFAVPVSVDLGAPRISAPPDYTSPPQEPDSSETPTVPAAPAAAGTSAATEPDAPSEDEEPARGRTHPAPASTMEFLITTDGLVVPPATRVAWAGSPRLAVQAAASAATDVEAVFWDAFPARDGLVAMVLGLVRSPNGRSQETADGARKMLRAAAMQGSGPARSLELVEGWLVASVPGPVWVSALVCHLDLRKETLAVCGVGSTAVAARLADGRCETRPAPMPPLGSSAGERLTDSYRVLLAGDHIVLCCGDIGRLETRRGRAQVGEALLGVSGVRGSKGLARLLEAIREPEGAAGVVGMDVVG